MTRLTDDQRLYVASMGKHLRVTAMFSSDDEANAYMATHKDDAVVACFGPFVLLANKYDNGVAVAGKREFTIPCLSAYGLN